MASDEHAEFLFDDDDLLLPPGDEAHRVDAGGTGYLGSPEDEHAGTGYMGHPEDERAGTGYMGHPEDERAGTGHMGHREDDGAGTGHMGHREDDGGAGTGYLGDPTTGSGGTVIGEPPPIQDKEPRKGLNKGLAAAIAAGVLLTGGTYFVQQGRIDERTRQALLDREQANKAAADFAKVGEEKAKEAALRAQAKQEADALKKQLAEAKTRAQPNGSDPGLPPVAATLPTTVIEDAADPNQDEEKIAGAMENIVKNALSDPEVLRKYRDTLGQSLKGEPEKIERFLKACEQKLAETKDKKLRSRYFQIQAHLLAIPRGTASEPEKQGSLLRGQNVEGRDVAARRAGQARILRVGFIVLADDWEKLIRGRTRSRKIPITSTPSKTVDASITIVTRKSSLKVRTIKSFTPRRRSTIARRWRGFARGSSIPIKPKPTKALPCCF